MSWFVCKFKFLACEGLVGLLASSKQNHNKWKLPDNQKMLHHTQTRVQRRFKLGAAFHLLRASWPMQIQCKYQARGEIWGHALGLYKVRQWTRSIVSCKFELNREQKEQKKESKLEFESKSAVNQLILDNVFNHNDQFTQATQFINQFGHN